MLSGPRTGFVSPPLWFLQKGGFSSAEELEDIVGGFSSAEELEDIVTYIPGRGTRTLPQGYTIVS